MREILQERIDYLMGFDGNRTTIEKFSKMMDQAMETAKEEIAASSSDWDNLLYESILEDEAERRNHE